MTRLPHDSWNVTARDDLPEYELPSVCQHPQCADPYSLENHHVWRRSFGRYFRESWWVQLPSGVVVANRVHLCPKHHQQVTENVAALRVLEDEGGGWTIIWEDATVDPPAYSGPLDPQPQGGASGRTPVGTENAEGRSAMQLTVDGDAKPHEEVCEEQHGEEAECSRCHGTGRIRKRGRKKQDSDQPQTAARKKTTWSVRVPRDEREDGHAVIEGLMEGTVEKLHEAGLIRDVNKGANYYALVYVLAFFEQNFDSAAEAAES